MKNLEICAVLLLTGCSMVSMGARYEREMEVEFVEFMIKFGKEYEVLSEEYERRFSIWKGNLKYIEDFNKVESSFRLGVNQFADLTQKEFKNQFLNLKTPSDYQNRKYINGEVFNTKEIPTSWDWRTKGVVTYVKNQEQCGGDWAFCVAEAVESCHAITTGNLVSLSVQNLMDCVNQGQGCNGGIPGYGYQYIMENGIDTESCYPYNGNGGQCEFNPDPPCCGSIMKGYYNISSGSENALQYATYQGPTSVAVDASQASFQMYNSGVYYDSGCSSSQLDHGMVVVGWGVDSDLPYWIVKNSWGVDWGMNGYIWMARNRSNNCGIATMASLPYGCSNCP